MVSQSRFASGVLLVLFPLLLCGEAVTNQYSPNLCLNGGFEQHLDAAASPLPQAWSLVGQPIPSATLSGAVSQGNQDKCHA
jgi:hypothetical protein